MKRVFIVHGHDHTLRDEVATYINSLGLEFVFVADHATQGNTLIEIFERAATGADYAVFLVTGDDLGVSCNDFTYEAIDEVFAMLHGVIGTPGIHADCSPVPEEGQTTTPMTADNVAYRIQEATRVLLKRRPSQTVLFGLGYSIGHFGRTHVCVLSDPHVEFPADVGGIGIISTSDDWQTQLQKRLTAAHMM